MNILLRIFNSIGNGSFGFKLLNRFARFKYVPEPDFAISHYLSEHYPGDGWKTMSPPARKVWVQYAPLFKECQIKTIAYVGANVGNTVLALDQAFPGLEFYLLEPAPGTFQQLLSNTDSLPNMHCINMAAGAREDLLDMHVDDCSGASSILSYRPIILEEFPLLGKQSIERVQVKPLDTILKDYQVEKVDLLLMDVQGYEDEVLRGATETLNDCKVVISELSLQEFYISSSTFDSVYKFLDHEGFRLRYLWNPLEGASLQIAQIDGVFIREAVK